MMYMKHIRLAALALMALAVSAFPLAADDGAASRKAMMAFAGEEIRLLSEREVAPSELGEWKDILDASLFLLIRKTEVYRGPVRVLVIGGDSSVARMYPDGTFVASTGLFDFIDRTLFEETAASSRRVRDFDSEREAMLAPILAPEIARFALDQQFAAWEASRGTYLESDTKQRFEADALAVALLDLAGYGGSAMSEWLNRLQSRYADNTVDIALEEYIRENPSPFFRLDALEKASPDIERMTDDFASALTALKYGTPVKSAQESLEALAERYPASPYVARLAAIAAHMRVLESMTSGERTLPVFFPIATVSGRAPVEGSGNRASFLELAKTRHAEADRTGTARDALTSLPVISASKPSPANAAPVKAALIDAALSAYGKALSLRDEPGLASSRARLLARPGNAKGIAEARAAAESAALAEAGSRSFTSRANWAALLFLLGDDYAKAQKTIESPFASTSAVSSRKFLDTGCPGDARDLSLSHAIMLRLLGDDSRADARAAEADSLYRATISKGTIDLRRVSIGDAVDSLSERWGRPASILYDYYSETWKYPSLAATVMVGKTVEEVSVGPGSPVSPGGDVRCGDRREDFESFFGKAAYRAGDCDVYVKDGNRIAVLYLAGRIRFMTFGL